ncbi:hypothetical protein A3C26_02290 [Candidatus Daviesbacteria bacterium RIFCSPHIGHO2_02_FULL_39_12]|uniref:NusB/RsmB/TIM44 domain-containing protein n=2 Tax=Candidatus Daviesiibacteriota TaxID=1752718 RepID=A0A1F5JA50_9BACT|nr:MAG: hypothetical protein A3C26_02290 [Candidatus Daviesbacteria bacterium RIFCSPHIGHO2_02_FULL_39_12]
MKLKSDPRHIKRIKLMQKLFSWQFRPGNKAPKRILPIVDNLAQIDKLIAEGAPDRPISEINKIDLSILRLAVFELIIEKDTPFKVIIDEAVELGKEFGSDSSGAFINGALGKVVEIKKIKLCQQV